MQYSAIPLNDGNLRPHQIDAKRKIFDAWDVYNAVMLQMPTGTGKTYLFTSIIKDLVDFYKSNRKEIRILVCAHRMELLDQISDSLNKYGIPHGFIQGNREQYLWQRVQVGSIMSLLTSKNEMNVKRLDFDFIIVDEAHHTLANTYKSLFESFPNAKKLGVTATPWRLNHESFIPTYEYLITTPQVSWFIKKGLLSDFDYVSIKPDSEIQRLVNSMEISPTGDFVNEELDKAFDNQRIRAKLWNAYFQFAFGRKGIVYAINKQHAKNLADMFNSKGVPAAEIDCDTPKDDRKLLIDDFKDGKIQVLVNVEIFTEGFDCPDVSFIQLARPTRSLALYLQQVGRGLRVVDGKEKTIILDNVGLYNYFGLPDANRKWQHHFIGKEVPDEIKRPKERIQLPISPDGCFDEEDDPMMVVRGSGDDGIIPFKEKDHKKHTLIPEDFSVCDYFQIIGVEDRFSVYPIVKKNGKSTDALGASLLDYNTNFQKIVFTADTSANKALLARYPKVRNIVMFAANLAEIPTKDAVNLSKFGEEKELSLFNLLKILQVIYKDKQSKQAPSKK